MNSNYLHSVIIEGRTGVSLKTLSDGKIELRNIKNILIEGRELGSPSATKHTIFELKTLNGSINEVYSKFGPGPANYDELSSVELVNIIAKATEVLTQRAQKPRIHGYQIGELSNAPGAGLSHLEKLNNKQFNF